MNTPSVVCRVVLRFNAVGTEQRSIIAVTSPIRMLRVLASAQELVDNALVRFGSKAAHG